MSHMSASICQQESDKELLCVLVGVEGEAVSPESTASVGRLLLHSVLSGQTSTDTVAPSH